MEMTWMETIELLGLDLLAAMLLAVVVLVAFEHAMNSARETARGQFRRRPQRPSVAIQPATVSCE